MHPNFLVYPYTPSNGTALIDGNGTSPETFTYQPDTNFHGSDTFSVMISDGENNDSITINLTINPVDDPAIIIGDFNKSTNIGEIIHGDLNVTDIDGLSDGSYFSISVAPANGTADIDVEDGNWSYTPDINSLGNIFFVVKITDDLNQSYFQTVSLNVSLVPLTDQNFNNAIDLWFTNQQEANSTFGHICDWNTSAITQMVKAFENRTNFNEDISAWDVSKVTSMNNMFANATAFNQPIGLWDLSSLETMWGMFKGATSFNQPIGNWDVSGVMDMGWLFKDASSFNQELSNWVTSNVNSMDGMFAGATKFNQPIGNWDVSGVNNFSWMFEGSSLFDQPIGNWNTSSSTNMAAMFKNATSFDQDISSWDVSSKCDAFNV